MCHSNCISKIALAFVLLTHFVCCASAAHAQAADLHDAATQLTKKLGDDPDVQKLGGERIVVAPFENINGKGDAVPRILQEMMTTAFIKAKRFKVVERDQLQTAVDELHFQLSDLADPAKAKKIGKQAGATYILLGSISDTGGTTAINARIVSIESGESVSADDIDIKTGDAASGVGGLNPAANPVTTIQPDATQPTATVKQEVPAIDLNERATSVSAGQYIGQKSNFGLLGSAKFNVAWREALGQQPIYSISAGDVIGDGTRRLVEYTDGDTHRGCVRVLRWEGGKFKQTWQSEAIEERDTLNRYNNDTYYLRTSGDSHKPAIISLCDASCRNVWSWDGTTFVPQARFAGSVREWLAGKSLTYIGTSRGEATVWGEAASTSWGAVTITNAADKENECVVDFQSFGYNPGVTVADLDGDGKLEVAKVDPSDGKTDGKLIEIYSLTGLRKAITQEGYGCRLTTWNPTAFKVPFLVARKNTVDADGKPGGYVYFVMWNGESYERVWKSNQIDDAVIDMQVCDPKGEGKPGLVILSMDKSGYYLTKIVHVN